jgi:hypothetical protein
MIAGLPAAYSVATATLSHIIHHTHTYAQRLRCRPLLIMYNENSIVPCGHFQSVLTCLQRRLVLIIDR